MGYAALESGAENVPTFQNVEIGGGRITGTEVTADVYKRQVPGPVYALRHLRRGQDDRIRHGYLRP